MAISSSKPCNLVSGAGRIDPLLRASEVRGLVGDLSPSTLYLWRSKGLMPEPIVIRRKLYWRRSVIHGWLEAMNGEHSGRTE